MRKQYLLLLLAAGPLACSDTPAQPELNPPLAFAANPNSSGTLVVRYEDTFGLIVFDAETELLAYHSYRNAIPACGQTVTERRFAEVQDVINGNEALQIKQLFKVDGAFTWIWHSTTGNFFTARCTTPVATGSSDLIYTDNDIYAFLADHVRANAFGFTAHGELVGGDGTVYRYVGLSRVKWQPNSGDANYRYDEIASVGLTPIRQ